MPDDYRGREVTVKISLDDRLTVFAGDEPVTEHLLKDQTEGW
ncbi:MAG: hypothetical protein ACYC51_05330, partial [Thermoleophilia bacterium]